VSGGTDNTRLARLRALRNRPERDVSIGAALGAERQRLARVHRAVGGAGAAWAATVPAALAERCEVVRLVRGVLTVRVPDDSTRYTIDRWLRSGGRQRLAQQTPATLTRVRLVL
jgi:hypothetical protein